MSQHFPGELQTMEDWAWLQKVQEGDASAFQGLFERYQRRVLNLAYRFVRDRASAEDIAQEVFIKIFEKRVKADSKAKFTTWLYRVTVNASLDQLRKRKFTPRSLDAVIEGQRGEKQSFGDHVPDTKKESPRVQMEAEERAQWVTRAIDQLPEKWRSPLLLYQFENLSYGEIAQVLGISPKAVERRLYHAKARLRESLGPLQA